MVTAGLLTRCFTARYSRRQGIENTAKINLGVFSKVLKGVLIPIPSTMIIKNPNSSDENREIPNIDLLTIQIPI